MDLGFEQDTCSQLNLSKLNNDVLLIIIEFLGLAPSLFISSTDKGPPTSLTNLSLVNGHFRGLIAPILFSSKAIVRPRIFSVLDFRTATDFPKLPNGWDIAYEAIEFLSKDVSIARNIKSFHLDLYGHVWENDYALAAELAFIVTFLRKLKKVQRLQIQVPDLYMYAFEQAIASANEESLLVFEGVETLTVEYRLASLLRHCPRVQHLALLNTTAEDIHLYQLNLVDLVKRAPHIIHIEPCLRLWMLPEIHHLSAALPCLEYLHVTGYSIYPKLSELSRWLGDAFKHLKVLVLPGVERIDTSWYTKPIGRPFTASSGPRARREEEERRRKAQNKAAGFAFGSINSLEECWVGESAVAYRISGDEEFITEEDSNSNLESEGEASDEEDLEAEIRKVMNDEESEDEEENQQDPRSDHDKWADMMAYGASNGVKWKWTRSPPGFLLNRENRLINLL